jgi:hypothetical protein
MSIFEDNIALLESTNSPAIRDLEYELISRILETNENEKNQWNGADKKQMMDGSYCGRNPNSKQQRTTSFWTFKCC